ncbi:MAG: cation transporter [Oscillibacter sp.]|nr:cation transporter [Oscillibacter sp.]
MDERTLQDRGTGPDRERVIIRTSFVGIGVNVVLVLFKMAVGLAANSIAVILDAVNNLSDALSSVITILGTKLAAKAPDKQHPYGYGRVEYLTSVVIAALVLSAGFTSLKESVEKVLHPQAASYSAVSLVIIAAAVAAKLLCGRYVRSVGERVHAQSLVASGSDALFDAVLSFATLVAAAVSLLWHIDLEGPLGAVISIFILKAGFGMLRETLDSIIGTRADPQLTQELKETVCAHPEVRGAYDLTLHNYGPTQLIGSVHVEVADELTARELHELTRRISEEVFARFGIILTVGIYAANDSSAASAALRQSVEAVVAEHPEVLQMHGFYVDEGHRRVLFDLVVDFSADASAARRAIHQRCAQLWPDYRFDIILDSDYSD